MASWKCLGNGGASLSAFAKAEDQSSIAVVGTDANGWNLSDESFMLRRGNRHIARDVMSVVYKKKDDVVFRRIAGEMLLIPIRGSLADLERLFVLDGTGEFIWEQLDGKRTATDIAHFMAQRFDVDSATAGKDVQDFVAQLQEAGLVTS